MECGKGDRFLDSYFQRVSEVSISRNIRDRIDSRHELWKKCAYNKLVHDSHRVTEEALGNKHRKQTQEQRHRTFSSLVLRGKLRKSICFICNRGTFFLVYPKNGRLDNTTS